MGAFGFGAGSPLSVPAEGRPALAEQTRQTFLADVHELVDATDLREILDAAGLPLRAGEALLVLVSLLLVAVLVLVPGQGRVVLGAELGALAVVLLASLGLGVSRRRRDRAPEDPLHWILVPMAIMALVGLLLAACGVSMILGHGGGLYWLVPWLVIGFAGAVFNGWVLLIEILR